MNAAAPLPAGLTEGRAWYVYAIFAGGPGISMPEQQAVVPEACLQTVSTGALTALVSDVPLALFTAANGPAADPSWIAGCAERHHAVVASLQTPNLPLGFGTVFASRPALEAWLTQHVNTARDALTRLANRAEWAVTLQEDEAVHTTWLQANAASLIALSDQQQTVGPGAAFLIGKRMTRAVAEARQAHLAEMAAETDAEIRQFCPDILAATPGGQPASWSLLADPDVAVPDRLGALTDRLRPVGLELRVTGPWPPYAFARSYWQQVAS